MTVTKQETAEEAVKQAAKSKGCWYPLTPVDDGFEALEVPNRGCVLRLALPEGGGYMPGPWLPGVKPVLNEKDTTESGGGGGYKLCRGPEH